MEPQEVGRVFLTLLFPFVDLRPFVLRTPETVLRHLSVGEPFEAVNRTREGYVRSFGGLRERGFIPNFRPKGEKAPPEADYPKSLRNLWTEEFFFADAHRGLLLPGLERQALAGGKLSYPRAKVRSLRFSLHPPSDPRWSPSIRIETGINYLPREPLGAGDLIYALHDFLHLPSRVPRYEITRNGQEVLAEKHLCDAPLIKQPKALARLIVAATTSQDDATVHYKMVVPEAPLLTVHFFQDELSDVPENVEWLPPDVTNGQRIGYFPFSEPGTHVGVWMFQLPSCRNGRSGLREQRGILRNYTIAAMRYWTELRSAVAVRKSLLAGEFGYCLRGNSILQDYFRRRTRFLFKKTWHDTNLSIISSVVSAYEELPDEAHIRDATAALQTFPRQIAQNAGRLFEGIGRVGVFVSYSHLDSPWRTKVQAALAGLLSQEQIAYFDDTGLEAGENWFRKIVRSIDTANVAVLLISDHFMKSDFILKHELPKIEELHQRRKLGVIPVWVSGEIPDSWWMSNLQFHKTAEGPLERATSSSLSQAMDELVQRVKEISDEYRPTISVPDVRVTVSLGSAGVS